MWTELAGSRGGFVCAREDGDVSRACVFGAGDDVVCADAARVRAYVFCGGRVVCEGRACVGLAVVHADRSVARGRVSLKCTRVCVAACAVTRCRVGDGVRVNVIR